MKRGLIVACALLPLTGAIAAEKEHEEHGAHEHGHGKFNVAIEGNTMAMELMSPGADIVGFEHVAKSEADKQAIEKAKKILADVANVLEIPSSAGCTLASVKVEVHREGEHDDHDDHAHEKKDDDHAHEKEDHKHDDHGHEKKEANAGEEHGEFHVNYEMKCKAPNELTAMSFPYFDTFAGAKELEVTVVGPKKQQKFEVERGAAKIALGGIM